MVNSSSRLTVLAAPPPMLNASPDERIVVDHQIDRVDQVLDEQDVTHLPAVAVDRDRLRPRRLQQEVGDPALILVAALVRPVDAAHPEDDASIGRTSWRSRARTGRLRPSSSRTGCRTRAGARSLIPLSTHSGSWGRCGAPRRSSPRRSESPYTLFVDVNNNDGGPAHAAASPRAASRSRRGSRRSRGAVADTLVVTATCAARWTTASTPTSAWRTACWSRMSATSDASVGFRDGCPQPIDVARRRRDATDRRG